MGHAVHALVTTLPIARRATSENRAARAFMLPQGFAIVPLVAELVESLEETEEVSLDEFVAKLSNDGMVVQIETDYFGGIGSQRATAWKDGCVVFGPTATPIDSQTKGPINEALRLLGVKASVSDEFDSLGLGLVRHTDDWLDKGKPV